MAIFDSRIRQEFLTACEGIAHGTLHLKTPEGDLHVFGNSSPVAEMHIRDWACVTAMAARGDIGLGETYVDGLWDTPSVEMLTRVALLNLSHFSGFAYPSFWQGLKFRTIDRLVRANSRKGSSRNIRAHYDVGNEFFQLWLDPGMTYSSALFADGDTDLGRAQNRKYDRILNGLSDGETVLEIGCGWGGFAERAADQGRAVTGLTISPSQKGYADARLDGRADIRLCDYRDVRGTFDNIVSIEMIEAVGERYWPMFFNTLKARLATGGKAMVQAITVPDSYFETYRKGSDFIRQHTFPGGMLLSDGAIARAAQDAGLRVRDNFSLGRDYARTCRIWDERMCDTAAKAQKLGYGEGFLRSWRFYLGICAASFEVGQTDVVQVKLSHA